jgi:hypothetical protein
LTGSFPSAPPAAAIRRRAIEPLLFEPPIPIAIELRVTGWTRFITVRFSRISIFINKIEGGLRLPTATWSYCDSVAESVYTLASNNEGSF